MKTAPNAIHYVGIDVSKAHLQVTHAKGSRFISGGRAKLRRLLFMAAVSLARSKKSPLASFYRRLRQLGKPPIVALIASARKLIVYLNSLFKNLFPIPA